MVMMMMVLVQFYRDEDDLSRSGFPDSKRSGHRIACCLIKPFSDDDNDDDDD